MIVFGKSLVDLIDALVDVEVEVGCGDEIVHVNDESGEIIGHVTGVDVQNGVPWISFQKVES